MGVNLTVSSTYEWDESTNELINRKTRERCLASSFEGKVNLYESRVREWFLGIAANLVSEHEWLWNDSPGDYVALSIALAYIEGVEQYRRGEKTPSNQSRKWFKATAERVFPGVSAKALDRLWSEARCGLFHSGFTDGRTYVSQQAALAIDIDQDQLLINPRKFVDATVIDFSEYIAELRADPGGELAVNFERLWDYRWDNS